MLDMKQAENLEEKLRGLTGDDFEAAEREERMLGNNFAPDISLTKSFQIRLAAKALGVPADEVRRLPMNQYNMIASRVFNFLFNPSDAETPATDSGGLPSASGSGGQQTSG